MRGPDVLLTQPSPGSLDSARTQKDLGNTGPQFPQLLKGRGPRIQVVVAVRMMAAVGDLGLGWCGVLRDLKEQRWKSN